MNALSKGIVLSFFVLFLSFCHRPTPSGGVADDPNHPSEIEDPNNPSDPENPSDPNEPEVPNEDIPNDRDDFLEGKIKEDPGFVKA